MRAAPPPGQPGPSTPRSSPASVPGSPAATAWHPPDPIIAVATAPGRGAVGIVRASGPDLSVLIDALCGRALAPRQATLLPLRDAAGAVLDRALVLHFPAPNSYTGEEVLELQAHGGFGAGIDQVGHGLGLGQVELVVEEGALGEFTRQGLSLIHI